MKLGLLGGTFNPVHMAHLRIAEEARELQGLDKIMFIPAADPPHKPLVGGVPFAQRHEMVKTAIKDNSNFLASDIEARLGGKSYTVETLPALKKECPDAELFFIIGSDSYLELGQWHRFDELFALTSLIVVERPGSQIDEPIKQLPKKVRDTFVQGDDQRLYHESGRSISFIKGTLIDISSSELRGLIKAGRSIRYLVPPAVETYIAQKGLYLNDREKS